MRKNCNCGSGADPIVDGESNAHTARYNGRYAVWTDKNDLTGCPETHFFQSLGQAQSWHRRVVVENPDYIIVPVR